MENQINGIVVPAPIYYFVYGIGMIFGIAGFGVYCVARIFFNGFKDAFLE